MGQDRSEGFNFLFAQSFELCGFDNELINLRFQNHSLVYKTSHYSDQYKRDKQGPGEEETRYQNVQGRVDPVHNHLLLL